MTSYNSNSKSNEKTHLKPKKNRVTTKQQNYIILINDIITCKLVDSDITSYGNTRDKE